MREIAPIFSTAAGALIGYAVSQNELGACLGATIGLVGEIVISHLPFALNSTFTSGPE
jgi:hypothetical protein